MKVVGPDCLYVDKWKIIFFPKMEDDPGVYAVLIKICRSDSKCKSISFNATVLKHQQS